MSSLIESIGKFSESGGLSSVLSLVTSGIGAIGGMQASSAEANAIEAKGKMERDQAIFEAEKKKKEGLATASRQKALYAKAGVNVTAGSPLEVMQDTQNEYAADVAQILKSGDQELALSKTQAKNVRTAGWFKTSGSVLKGLTDFSQSSLLKKKTTSSGGYIPGAWG